MANVITPLSAEDQLALRNKAKAELEEAVISAAIESTKMDVPAVMVENEIDAIDILFFFLLLKLISIYFL